MASAAEVRPVVLHTSWRGRFQQAIAPLILFGIAAAGFARAGEARPVPVVLSVIGLVILTIQLFDFPIVSVFGPDGVERRCVLRRQLLTWEVVESIARPGSTETATPYRSEKGRNLVARQRTRSPRQGLVAEVGKRRRRHLLTDHVEGRAEYDAIEQGMRAWSPLVPLRASRPSESSAPTFIYKRRRGTPDSLPVDRL